jgi:hypothetical protein
MIARWIRPLLSAAWAIAGRRISKSYQRRFRAGRTLAHFYRGVTACARSWFNRRLSKSGNLERVMGIEPTLAAWEAAVLPLNYTRIVVQILGCELVLGKCNSR